jgi:Mrp family chromosome partitioning ATPase
VSEVRAVSDEPPALVASAGEEAYVGVAFCPLPAADPPVPPAYERFAPELVAFHQPGHAISEQYRSLLAGIEGQLLEGPSHVLLFTAAAPRAGTTTVLLNLAITCARRKKCRVALVDANLGRPALADRLGLRTAPGLSEVLGGALSPERALQETGEARLAAMTAGDVELGQDGGIGGDVMRAVLRYLRGRFDRVLVDAPAWDGRPEVVALGAACDAVYLVAPEDRAEAVKDLLQQIPRQGSRLRGTIATRR